MIYQARNGISLGANETFMKQHQVSADTDLALGRLSTVLEWKSQQYKDTMKVHYPYPCFVSLHNQFSHTLLHSIV